MTVEHPAGLSLAELSEPIDGGAGEDLSFSELFDRIREARRADPDYLSQGEWQTSLKQADWEQVIQLTGTAIATQSKDLMLAGWLTEALTHQQHFTGMAYGLTVTDTLLQQFWKQLFPLPDDGLEERIARLDWLNDTLSSLTGTLPITQDPEFGLFKYEESRQVENLARQHPEAMAEAQREGRINAEIFHRAVLLTSTEHLQQKYQEIRNCLTACKQLQATLDRQFGQEAPGFTNLHERLACCTQLVERLLAERGIDQPINDVHEATMPQQPAESLPISSHTPPPSTPQSNGALRTQPQTREEAFLMLQSVAQFFRQSEPHSPVPYLIERAVKWGHMPLENWLRDVIKDGQVINAIQDTLGTLETQA